jgi:hypothetical protein
MENTIFASKRRTVDMSTAMPVGFVKFRPAYTATAKLFAAFGFNDQPMCGQSLIHLTADYATSVSTRNR